MSPRSNAIVLAASLPVLIAGSGCALPLVVFPAPDKGSGTRIVFHDEDDQPIHKDGLLLIRREYYTEGAWFPMHPPTSLQLVEIRDGAVNLPLRLKIASLWLSWLINLPLLVVNPTQNTWVYPFVPGYYSPALLEYEEFRKGKVVLITSGDTWTASARWEVDFGAAYDLRRADRDRLEKFVDAEEERLRQLGPVTRKTRWAPDGTIILQPPCTCPSHRPSDTQTRPS
jgi:hypothetical protein